MYTIVSNLRDNKKTLAAVVMIQMLTVVGSYFMVPKI